MPRPAELQDDLDIDVAVDMLTGPVLLGCFSEASHPPTPNGHQDLSTACRVAARVDLDPDLSRSGHGPRALQSGEEDGIFDQLRRIVEP